MSANSDKLGVAIFFFVTLFSAAFGDEVRDAGKFPLVVSTWPFLEAVRAAWRAVDGGLSAVDAVVEGCSACEELRCDGTVGPGGSPDENGETTIDAMIMNGITMEVGAVAAMRYVSNGIKAARLVMQHTKHTMLIGEQASIFAISMGLPGPKNLSSEDSIEKWKNWKKNKCQPNFRKNVMPIDDCGPYHPESSSKLVRTYSCWYVYQWATFKIPGRVGDGPIAGSSAYADTDVGACGATGDGDTMMRFLPCYQVVESMRLGMEPKLAAQDAIARIARKYPDFVGAVFAVNKNGIHAGACHGWTFQYSVRSPDMADVEVYTVTPEMAAE
ncbi:UNVERIFIED_CONTAM: putative isoaspartyl peptidase/L-asparaginase 3 [Sesamum calycinum]|uniref:beta-aspartyl-peptidase n=1 Tax=Sesamum calycinum TaxID=2727403 RepID=A0AAW2RPY8_9LAMI